jgi:hypothetical protein
LIECVEFDFRRRPSMRTASSAYLRRRSAHGRARAAAPNHCAAHQRPRTVDARLRRGKRRNRRAERRHRLPYLVRGSGWARGGTVLRGTVQHCRILPGNAASAPLRTAPPARLLVRWQLRERWHGRPRAGEY